MARATWLSRLSSDPYRTRAHSCLPACSSRAPPCCWAQAPRAPERTPKQIKADIARRIPAGIPDRGGWAGDVYVALASQRLATSADNICTVLAVIEQESTDQADPSMPGLVRSRAELARRGAALHVSAFVLEAALGLASPNGRSYGERIASARTEQELSGIFEDYAGSVPLGQRLFGGLNPVHTGAPVQVSIAFAEAHTEGYPYPLQTRCSARCSAAAAGSGSASGICSATRVTATPCCTASPTSTPAGTPAATRRSRPHWRKPAALRWPWTGTC